MIYESKILNVTLRRPKIHFVPDVVYAQVPTFERPNQLLQADLLFQALKAQGVEAERYIVPNANHADDYWQQEEVFDVITKFLTRYIN